MRDLRLLVATALVAATQVGCERGGTSVTCGINALVRPLAVKDAFASGGALAATPEFVPAAVPVRLVAGPAWRGDVGTDSGGWRVTVRGTVAAAAPIGYGVLVVDQNDASQGVLIFDGRAVRGAARLGVVAMRDTVVPLLGVRVDPAALQDAKCPLFPDSLR
ncbi:MAG: hypothetical protein ACREL5_08160 [Gemmatimonadales bacterium]